MIDFNVSEILILGVLAVIIFGPEKLPEVARKAARVLNYLRNIANDAQGRLRQELGPEFADLELADLNPRAFVQKNLLDPVQVEVNNLNIAGDVAAITASTGAPGPSAPEHAAAALVEPVPAMAAVAFDTEAT
ncbi:MAG TPA: sec-independent translocase [Propionicimonas sp.]|nr:sec-independent translocase [Propionicimonas sp.]